MASIKVPGTIGADGRLEVDLPSDAPAGDVWVTIELPVPAGEALPAVTPLAGAEIVESGALGTWGASTEDGAAWVEELRRRRSESRRAR